MKRIVAAFLMVIMLPVMPVQAKDFIEVEVTYYIPTGNLTKTETVPKEGRTIAVDPELIPLGSCVRSGMKKVSSLDILKQRTPVQKLMELTLMYLRNAVEKKHWNLADIEGTQLFTQKRWGEHDNS